MGSQKQQGRRAGVGDYNVDDIIAGILGFMGSPEESARITGNLLAIHRVICELREKYPLLRQFPFQIPGGDVPPVSPLLERVMNRLAAAEVLRPLDGYVVGRKAKGTIKRWIHPRFSKEQLAELQEIAKELEGSILAPPED